VLSVSPARSLHQMFLTILANEELRHEVTSVDVLGAQYQLDPRARGRDSQQHRITCQNQRVKGASFAR